MSDLAAGAAQNKQLFDERECVLRILRTFFKHSECVAFLILLCVVLLGIILLFVVELTCLLILL